jgi:hypothetical protein
VVVDVDQKGVGDLKSLKGIGAELGNNLAGLTGSFAGMAAAAGPAGLAVAAVGGAAFFAVKGVTALAQQASGLEQSVGGADAVFKDTSQAMQDYATTADQTAGLSTRAYLDMATVIGAQLKNLGFTLAESATLTTELTQRGADLAATFGGSTADAIDAITSALRGEMDPIEKYGISAGEAAIKTKALELGFWDGTGAITAHSKAMTVNALIMEQSADAAGQFARESDSLAGKQAKLNAEWENMTTSLGEGVLPLVTDFVTVGNELVSTLGDLTSEGSDLNKVWSNIPEPLQNTLKGLVAISNLPVGIAIGVHKWAENIDAIPPKIEVATAAQQALTKEANDWAYANALAGAAAEKSEADIQAEADALKDLKSAISDAAGAFADIGSAQRSELKFHIDKDNIRDEITDAFKGKKPVKFPKNGIDMSDVELLPNDAQDQLLRLSDFVQQGLEEGARLAEIDPKFDPKKFESKLRGETIKMLVDAGMKPGAAGKVVDELLLGAKDAKIDVFADLTKAIQALNKFLAGPKTPLVVPVEANVQPAILTLNSIPVPTAQLPVEAQTARAESDLDHLARNRTATVTVKVRKAAGSGGTSPDFDVNGRSTFGTAATIAGVHTFPGSQQVAFSSPRATTVISPAGSAVREGDRTVLRPKDVPIKIYLDGAEIADHLQLKAGRLATATTVRRRA